MLGWKEEFGNFRDWGLGGGVTDRGGESVRVGGSFIVELNRQWGTSGCDRVWALHISTRSSMNGETCDNGIE
jgi:hypothetical protein